MFPHYSVIIRKSAPGFALIALSALLGVFPVHAVEQRPCAEEIGQLCKDVQPGEGRLLKCLKEHEAELSPVCKGTLEKALKRVEEAKAACSDDVARFCAGIKPGGGRMMSCLKEHVRELAPACREKLKPAKENMGKKPDEGKQ